MLEPEITFDHTDDFSDGVADFFTGLATGIWQLNGQRFEGAPHSGDDIALTTFDLSVGPTSILQLEATFTTDSLGGFFFDYYGEQDYKFAGVLPDTDQVVIGHWTRSGSLVYDAVADLGFDAGPEYDLRVSLRGTTASVSVDGHEVVGYVYNAVGVDGAFGLMTAAGGTSFDSVTVRTDDPTLGEPAGENLLAASIAAAPVGIEGALSEAVLAPFIDEAIRRWTESLGLAEGAVVALESVSFQIADLDGPMLGRVNEDTVWLDATAAGHGWFIDETPEDDVEFRAHGADGALRATPTGEAFDAVDLLSVVIHELGHVLGLDSHELLSPTLDTGLRVLPSAGNLDTGSTGSASLNYVVRVLATEGWQDEEDDDWKFAIREISFEDEEAAPILD